jgi:hypothetical protein
MTGARKSSEHGIFPDSPPIFVVDEADAEAAIGFKPEAAASGDKKALGAGKRRKETSHPGMMGDGTEEQNLDQPGDPAARIKEDEVDAAFDGKPS